MSLLEDAFSDRDNDWQTPQNGLWGQRADFLRKKLAFQNSQLAFQNNVCLLQEQQRAVRAISESEQRQLAFQPTFRSQNLDWPTKSVCEVELWRCSAMCIGL